VAPETYADELMALGHAAGLDAIGVAPAEQFEQTRITLQERKTAGLHGGMQFTYRNPARSTDPHRTLESARSMVVAAKGYPVVANETGSPTPQRARVASYAVHDQYSELRTGLEVIATRLRDDGFAAVVLADDNALVDREAAYRAGLGWYGKNANLLVEGQGSWFVLGSVLTDADLPASGEPVSDGCGSCARCIQGCPTGAIVAPGVLDANRCLAWLVQSAGIFPAEHRVALGDRLYGCDDCQLVCPVNRRHDERRALAEVLVTSEPPAASEVGEVDVLEVLAASDAELLDRFGRWYIPNRDVRYLRRNALMVLGNTGDPGHPGVLFALRQALADPDDLIAGHAVWAARRLGRPDLVVRAGIDIDQRPALKDEILAPVEVRR